MQTLLKSLCFVAFAAFAHSVPAQQAEAPTPQTPALDAPAVAQVGQMYVREEFGDWSLRCIRAPEGQADECTLYQLLFSAEGASVAEVNIFELPSGGQAVAGATIVVPLETLLTEQVTIAVDGQNARVYPFNFCNQAGCVARVGFTQAEVDAFKRGITAIVRIVPAAAPDQNVVLDVSLLGFTAGYEAAAGR